MQGSQLERGEPLRDTARVLSGYCHGIMVRTFGHDRAEEMARYAAVPVINGLTDLLHPCQVLADLQTVAQRFGGPATSGASLRSVKYAWIGDGNNMANSWIEAAGILGLDLALACPAGYEPDADVHGAGAGHRTRHASPLVRDPAEAAAGRHVISTDVFASMGQEAEADARRRAFAGYCIDAALLARRGSGRDGAPLPARPPRRGDHRRRHRGAVERGLAAGGEPPARPEGAARDAASVSVGDRSSARSGLPNKGVEESMKTREGSVPDLVRATREDGGDDASDGRRRPARNALKTAEIDVARDRRATLTSPIPAMLAESMSDVVELQP